MNKSVCQKCYTKNIIANSIYISPGGWTVEQFMEVWDSGVVICPHHIVFPDTPMPGTWSVNKEMAFDKCPFKFEHAVADCVNIDRNKDK